MLGIVRGGRLGLATTGATVTSFQGVSVAIAAAIP